jgi:DNA-binding MarR family transcriptional regulator
MSGTAPPPDETPDQTLDLPGPEAMLCFNLYAASHAFTRVYKPLLEPLGLTYPQYLVLLCLAPGAPRGVRDLAEALRLETNTLSPLLKRLEASGLIRRTRSSADERRVEVALTGRGRALAAEAARIPARLGARLAVAPEALAEAAERIASLRRVLEAAAHPTDAQPTDAPSEETAPCPPMSTP